MTDETLRIETVALSDRDKAIAEAQEVIRTHRDTLYSPVYLVSLLQRLVN